MSLSTWVKNSRWRPLALRARGVWYRLRNPMPRYSCNYCGYRAGAFVPAGVQEHLFDEKQIIGGGYRENVRCPRCNASDRERLVRLVFERHIAVPHGARILHVAPERNLNGYLHSLPGANVTEIDLDPSVYAWNKNVRAENLTSLSFTDGTFDLVVCNHVLEHVPDDRLAMRELYRVMKPGASAVLQVPYSDVVPRTDEDFSEMSIDERIRRFGQDDHVRLYRGSDFISRVESAGFVSGFLSAERFADDAGLGICPREGVFLFTKPAGVGAGVK